MAEQKNTHIFDEQRLGKLLEAAYVLQQHNREVGARALPQSRSPKAQTAGLSSDSAAKNEQLGGDDYSATLAEIAETQRLIQVRELNADQAMALIVRRVVEITHGSAAAIGILDGNNIQYRAIAGASELPLNATVSSEKALCFECLRSGQPVHYADVRSELLIDAAQCERRAIRSLIAVPVYGDKGVAGGLELYFDKAQAFTDHDIHTCQLMAGLVTEALAHSSQITSQPSVAAQRASVLEALEKLRPSLAALAATAAAQPAKAKPAIPAADVARHSCRKCGHQFAANENFCGQCGTPRTSDYGPPNLQSKVASLSQVQQSTQKQDSAVVPEIDLPLEIRQEISKLDRTSSSAQFGDTAAFITPAEKPHEPDEEQDPEFLQVSQEVTDFVEQLEKENSEDGVSTALVPTVLEEEKVTAPPVTTEEAQAAATTALAPVEKNEVVWSSAASARNYLEQLAASSSRNGFLAFWNSRRGDIYLAIAIGLLTAVLRWGLFSTPTVDATNAHRRSANPIADLSLFDRMLIEMGLAEAPEPPEHKGNPKVQVWVDQHTALYYCPGADLYGKTPEGRFTSQRDAQLDQFEPAYQRACD